MSTSDSPMSRRYSGPRPPRREGPSHLSLAFLLSAVFAISFTLLALACTGSAPAQLPTVTATTAANQPLQTSPTEAPTSTPVPAATPTAMPIAVAAPATPTAPPAPTSTPAATATPAGFPLTLAGSDSVEVTLEAPPERIVVYDAAAVETLFAIGEGHRVVATHSFVTYPPGTADIPKVGDAFNINVEQTVGLEPDLVFIFFPTFLEQLRNAGLKVLFIRTLNQDFRKTADNFLMWGRITDNMEAAERLAAEFIRRVGDIEAKLAGQPQGPRVFYDTFELWTPGPNTLVGEVLDLLKLQNVAFDVSGYQQMSAEVFVERDPEIIFTSDPGFFTGNPAFSQVSAVRNGRLLPPSELLSIAGPRFVDGIEELAMQVYPALFAEQEYGY